MSPVVEGPRNNVIHRGDVVVVAGNSPPAAVTSTLAAAGFFRWE